MLVPLLSPSLRRWLALLPIFCCAACSGNDKLNSVKGKVLYKGQPLKGAVVTFYLQGEKDDLTVIRPTGITQEDGTFTLTTGQAEGARAGTYVVTFTCPEQIPPKSKMSMEPPETKDRFDGAYADPAKSTTKVEIKKGTNQLEPFPLK